MGIDLKDGNPNMDYELHQKSYALFIKLVKFGSIAVVLILILMAIFLL